MEGIVRKEMVRTKVLFRRQVNSVKGGRCSRCSQDNVTALSVGGDPYASK